MRDIRGHLRFICLLVEITSISFNSIGAKAETEVRESRPELELYNEIFPHYVKTCAATQIKKTGKNAGGPAGHSLMYIKGLCRNKSASYPQVQECDSTVDLRNPDSGTLISVNKVFKNVNWVAIEGESLGFHGNLQPGQKVDKKAKEAAIQAAVQSGAFHGIEIHEEWAKKTPEGMTRDESAARISLGTDYAVNFGSTLYCSILPISQQQLRTMATYLNNINNKYRELNYEWNGLSNSCAHVIQNTLASVGIQSFQSVDRPMPLGACDFIVPSNFVLSLAIKAKRIEYPTLEELYEDNQLRPYFEKYGHLPILHGSLVAKIEMNKNNELYEPRKELFIMDVPLLLGKKDKLKRIFTKPVYSHLKSSLLNSKEKYLKLKAHLLPPNFMGNTFRNKAKKESSESFRAFYEKYKIWLEDALSDVDAKLKQLG